MRRLLSFVFLFGLSANFAFAQTGSGPVSSGPGNTEAIRWVLPGDFQDAQRQAVEKKRMLLIKGLGFGLDELGAKCATKGCW